MLCETSLCYIDRRPACGAMDEVQGRYVKWLNFARRCSITCLPKLYPGMIDYINGLQGLYVLLKEAFIFDRYTLAIKKCYVNIIN